MLKKLLKIAALTALLSSPLFATPVIMDNEATVVYETKSQCDTHKCKCKHEKVQRCGAGKCGSGKATKKECEKAIKCGAGKCGHSQKHINKSQKCGGQK